MNAAPQVPLSGAPAWIFLLCSALLATLLAAAALLVERRTAAVPPGKGSFKTDRIAAAAPAPAPKPAEAEKPAPAPPRVAPKATTAQPDVAVPPAAAPAPLKPVAPDASLAKPAAGQPESLYGSKASAQIAINDFAFPLPPGEWRVAADIPLNKARDLALVRESGKVIGAIALITYQWGGMGLGFQRGAWCSRPMIRGVIEKNDDFGEQACWSSSLMSQKTLLEYQPKSASGKALRGDLEAKGLTIGSEMLVDTVISFANMDRRVTMIIFYNPEADGFAPKKIDKADESDWHPKNLAQHPDKTKYIRDRLLWASQAYQQMKPAFQALK